VVRRPAALPPILSAPEVLDEVPVADGEAPPEDADELELEDVVLTLVELAAAWC
jgi:hypothetical protein